MKHPKTNVVSTISYLALACLLLQTPAFANSVTYTISVTIPAIVGVNVHPLPSMDTALSFAENGQFFWDVNFEEIWRGEEKLLVQSITEK